MRDIMDLATTMLWLVALFLVLSNAGGATRVITGFGQTWFDGMRVLQGR